MADKPWNESAWFRPRDMTAADKAKYDEEKRLAALAPADSGALMKAYDLLAPIYYKLKAKGGWIPPTLDELDGYLKIVDSKLGEAKFAGSVMGIDDKLASQIETASTTINKVRGRLSEVLSIGNDIAAAVELGRCAKVLSNWQGASGSVSNADAAKAFDEAFGALARFLSKVPLLGEYSAIFSEISKNNFFSNMSKLLNAGFERADAVKMTP